LQGQSFPDGAIVRKGKSDPPRTRYACSAATCRACALRSQCTKAKGAARSVKRHYHQEAVDAGRAQSASATAKRDRVRRKWLMEGSFADGANNHGFKRARWRRLWRQQIQDYMIAAVQNVRILIRHGDRQPTAAAQALQAELQNRIQAIYASVRAAIHALEKFTCCMSPSAFIAGRDTTYSKNVVLVAV